METIGRAEKVLHDDIMRMRMVSPLRKDLTQILYSEKLSPKPSLTQKRKTLNGLSKTYEDLCWSDY